MDRLVYVYERLRITDSGGNAVSFIGASVCLYDQRDDGTHTLIKYGTMDICKTMDNELGTYSITATNADPDNDGTSADVIVGLLAKNAIVTVTDYGKHAFDGSVEIINFYSQYQPIQLPYPTIITIHLISGTDLAHNPYHAPDCKKVVNILVKI